jgi:Na+/H+-dicarboxylate symporter
MAMSTASSRGATPDTIRRSEVKLGEREVVAVMVMCLGNGLQLQSA